MLSIPTIVLVSLAITGCSMPTSAVQRSLYSYSKEVKVVKGGLIGKKKSIEIKDFRENEAYDENIEDLQKVVEKYILEHPNLSDSSKDNLRSLKVTVGSTKDEVILLLGKPDKIINETSGALYGASEIWIYETNRLRAFTIFIVPVFFMHERYYLYFKDGAVAGIERHYPKQVVGQAPGPGLTPVKKK